MELLTEKLFKLIEDSLSRDEEEEKYYSNKKSLH
jgi:hypothetical protein